MHVLEAIEQRRAIKAFDPSHALSEPEIAQLMQAAMHSPTSFNIQNWRFVLVRDAEQRRKIRAAAWDQAQVTDSSLLVILCGDLKSWQEPAAYWRNTPPETQEFMIKATRDFYQGRGEEMQRDEVMRSTGMAAQSLMLAAKEMGYDTCPMVGFDPVEVGRIINLPENHVISMFVAIGKATKPAHPRSGEADKKDIVFYDRFAA